MKRFVFSLETLLRYRRNLDEKERTELSRLYFRVQCEREQHQEMLSRRQVTMTELGKRRNEGADHQEITWFYLYLDRLRDEIDSCSKRVVQLEQAIEVQRGVVVQSSKNRKILENLKDRKTREHFAELDKKDQLAVDELMITRFVNKQIL